MWLSILLLGATATVGRMPARVGRWLPGLALLALPGLVGVHPLVQIRWIGLWALSGLAVSRKDGLLLQGLVMGEVGWLLERAGSDALTGLLTMLLLAGAVLRSGWLAPPGVVAWVLHGFVSEPQLATQAFHASWWLAPWPWALRPGAMMLACLVASVPWARRVGPG